MAGEKTVKVTGQAEGRTQLFPVFLHLFSSSLILLQIPPWLLSFLSPHLKSSPRPPVLCMLPSSLHILLRQQWGVPARVRRSDSGLERVHGFLLSFRMVLVLGPHFAERSQSSVFYKGLLHG